jgi:hypothetical protein
MMTVMHLWVNDSDRFIGKLDTTFRLLELEEIRQEQQQKIKKKKKNPLITFYKLSSLLQ